MHSAEDRRAQGKRAISPCHASTAGDRNREDADLPENDGGNNEVGETSLWHPVPLLLSSVLLGLTLFWSHLPESTHVGFGCLCLFTEVPSWRGLVSNSGVCSAASCLLIPLLLSLHHHSSHSTHLWDWPWSCTKARCSLLHPKRTSQISIQKRRGGGPWSWNIRKEKHKPNLKLLNKGEKRWQSEVKSSW